MREARVIYANRAACELMGRSADTVVGRLLDEAFPGARSSGRYALYAEVYRTGLRRQLTFYHPQVAKWLRIVVAKVGDGFCIISEDVSEQKAAEAVLQRSNEELEALVAARTWELQTARDLAENANRAKSDFLSRASHELRTPLNAIIGFSGVLVKNRNGQLGAGALTQAERIHANGRHLLALVDDILDLARIEAGRIDVDLKEESLATLLADVRDTLLVSATEFGLTLTLEFVGPPAAAHDMRIRTDAQRLRQVLLNLVGNAIKFTQQGGVAMRAVADANGVPTCIEIADTGPGIKPGTLATMFEPFVIGSLAANGGQSTGLGLAISRSICALLGYRMTATSELGRGTIFSVDLTPASDQE